MLPVAQNLRPTRHSISPTAWKQKQAAVPEFLASCVAEQLAFRRGDMSGVSEESAQSMMRSWADNNNDGSDSGNDSGPSDGSCDRDGGGAGCSERWAAGGGGGGGDWAGSGRDAGGARSSVESARRFRQRRRALSPVSVDALEAWPPSHLAPGSPGPAASRSQTLAGWALGDRSASEPALPTTADYAAASASGLSSPGGSERGAGGGSSAARSRASLLRVRVSMDTLPEQNSLRVPVERNDSAHEGGNRQAEESGESLFALVEAGRRLLQWRRIGGERARSPPTPPLLAAATSPRSGARRSLDRIRAAFGRTQSSVELSQQPRVSAPITHAAGGDSPLPGGRAQQQQQHGRRWSFDLNSIADFVLRRGYGSNNRIVPMDSARDAARGDGAEEAAANDAAATAAAAGRAASPPGAWASPDGRSSAGARRRQQPQLAHPLQQQLHSQQVQQQQPLHVDPSQQWVSMAGPDGTFGEGGAWAMPLPETQR